MLDFEDPRETDPLHRNGYAPYPSTLVVSAPRSGLNLVRHIFESMGLRTPGKTHLLREGPFVFHRTHWVMSPVITPGKAPLANTEGEPIYEKVLLLLRDPLEIFVRAYQKDLQRMGQYCDNLCAYHDFCLPKMLVRYDELVSDDRIFASICSFMEVDHDLSAHEIPQLRMRSVSWYQANNAIGGGSQTLGSHAALNHHKQQLSRGERADLNRYLHDRLGVLASTYLGSWLD